MSKGINLAILGLVAFASLPVILAQNETGREEPVIGIDLGTTFSVVGVFHNGKVEILSNDQVFSQIFQFTHSLLALKGPKIVNISYVDNFWSFL